MQLAALDKTQSLLEQLVPPLGAAVGVTLALLILRHYLLRWIIRGVRRPRSSLDEVFLASLRAPTILWCLALGVAAGLEAAPLPQRLTAWGSSVVTALVILSVSLVVANLLARSLHHVAQRMHVETAVTGLGTILLKAIILTVGVLLVLSTVGVAISPVLAALGVGGLAVSLALQDTLSNLFAGVHILMEQPVRLGDYVKLETGQEGYVTDIGWRTTRIRMLHNNMVIVPNATLAQSILTNFHLPEPRMSLVVPVSVSYDADPDRVEQILVEEASRAAQDVPGLLADPPPFVRFIPGFGDSSLDFTLFCQVREYTDQYLAQHELRKRIFRRFRAEGVDIPFPQRVVHVRNGGEATRGGTRGGPL